MDSGCRTIGADHWSVVIIHENLDFVRDARRRLRSKGLTCRSLCELNVKKLDDIVDQAVTLVIDVDVIERHLHLLSRILRSRNLKERILFVNAKHYKKSDWEKIDTYCEMIALQDRLSRASRKL